jgi:hypothetical protein
MKIEFSHKDKLYIITFDGEKYNTVRTAPCCGKKVIHSVKNLNGLKTTLRKDKICRSCNSKLNGYMKGSIPHNKKFTKEYCEKTLREMVIEVTDKIGFAPPFQYFRQSKKYKTDANGIRQFYGSIIPVYNNLITELGFDYPEKKSGYYIDGIIIRGFYEFCAYNFIKLWGLKFESHPKVFSKSIGDGLFLDYDIYWEHWGIVGRNKNRNKLKRLNYIKNGLSLVSTYDDKVQKNGLEWFYFHFKQTLINSGVQIDYNESEDFDPIDVVRGQCLTYENVYQNVKNFFGDDEPKFHFLNGSLRYQVLHYFEKYSKFIKYCNKHFGTNWSYQEKDCEVQDVNHCINKIKPLIIELKRLPTDVEMIEKGFGGVGDALIKWHGGFDNFKKNYFGEGEYYHLIEDILGNKTPQDDKTIRYDDPEIFNKGVEYITNHYGEFPKYMRTIKDDREVYNIDKVITYFYFSLRKNGMSKYNSWSEFQKDWFGRNDSEKKQFKEIISYDCYFVIRKMIETNTKEQLIIDECQKKGFIVTNATIQRIKNNDRLGFQKYSVIFDKENPELVNGYIGPNRKGKRKFLTIKQVKEVKKLQNSFTEKELSIKFDVSLRSIQDIVRGRIYVNV